jgi:hypothetical protein
MSRVPWLSIACLLGVGFASLHAIAFQCAKNSQNLSDARQYSEYNDMSLLEESFVSGRSQVARRFQLLNGNGDRYVIPASRRSVIYLMNIRTILKNIFLYWQRSRLTIFLPKHDSLLNIQWISEVCTCVGIGLKAHVNDLHKRT